jgi:hypothetical protein
VRGTLVKLGLAESPPHPDRKNDPTSPRKRGEVIGFAYGVAYNAANTAFAMSAVPLLPPNSIGLIPPA